ncbi:hypothetical protein [Shewanella sp. S23-S33]|uniref:hypothetical protein n=1 Tax=Shewanella sp. S23-S33 TaxID=3342769 RepID=UPI00372D3770
MLTIYLIRQKGVYWKEIVGITTSESEAIAKCKVMASLDIDDYHLWVVTKHKIGEFICVNSLRDIQEPCSLEETVFSTDRKKEQQLC